MAESAVVKACLKYLAARRWLAWRSNNTGVYDTAKKCFRTFRGRKGVSDIISVVPTVGEGGERIGRILCVECKASTGLRPDQRLFRDDVVASGGLYVVARSVGDLIEALQREGY